MSTTTVQYNMTIMEYILKFFEKISMLKILDSKKDNKVSSTFMLDKYIGKITKEEADDFNQFVEKSRNEW